MWTGQKKTRTVFDIFGPGTLKVTVISAENLAENGTSDAFCKLYSNFGNQTFQTHTKKKTATPVWEESFPFYVGLLEESLKLSIKVYDREFVGQDFLGVANIKFCRYLTIANNYTYEHTFQLEEGPTKKHKKKPDGEKKPKLLKIGLQYFPVPDTGGAIFRTDPEKEYSFQKVIGKGTFGLVKRAVSKSGEMVAIKIMDKRVIKPEHKLLLEREVSILSRLQHPNIVSLIACYDTPKRVFFVLELVGGGELFKDIINRSEPYYEGDAANYVKQILRALEYMHSMGIAHRDLKPENLLLSEDKKVIKITDFGFSKDESDKLQTACGTALYVAPEVLSAAEYGTSCDIWSVGVITYILLSAHIPFDGPNEKEIFEKILNAEYYFPTSLWANISDIGKKFISEIFVVDPKLRLDATDCLKHTWLVDNLSHSSTELPLFRQNIAKFRESQKNLKKSREQVQHQIAYDDDDEDEDEHEDDSSDKE